MGLRKNDIRAIWSGKEPEVVVASKVKEPELELELAELKEKHAIKRGRKAKDNPEDNQEASKKV